MFLSGENIAGESAMYGTTCTSLCKHSCPRPKQCKQKGKVGKKQQNSSLTPKYRAEQFPNDLYMSVDMLFCKYCQHKVDWKHVDMCKDHMRSKACVKNKINTVLDVLSKGKICVKCCKNKIPIN